MRTAVREDRTIFTTMPVPRAVAFMVLPAIISQIIHVVYNLADTWFVGLTENANAVAAISLCLTLYNILTALSNLFGIGGASVIARYIGYGNRNRARRGFSVAVWGSVAVTAVYCLLLLFFQRPLLMMIGGDDGDIGYAVSYCFVTIVLGGIPTVLAATLSNLIRATGDSRRAAAGMTLGAVLNILLDPLFMFVLLPEGQEVLGAAIATALSNVISLVYFLWILRRPAEDAVSSWDVRLLKGSLPVLGDILRCGLAGFTMVALAMISNGFLFNMIAEYGSGAAVAGLGIVRKIDSLAYAVNQGITQGMLPLVAYSYAAADRERMKKIIGFSTVCTVCFSLLCAVVSFVLAPQLIHIFIRDAETIRYGADFLRICCIAIPIYSVTFVIIAVFQAAGQSLAPFILSVLHKGSVDILLLFLIRALFGVRYVLWASPVMETIALIVAVILLLHFLGTRARPNIKEVIT